MNYVRVKERRIGPNIGFNIGFKGNL